MPITQDRMLRLIDSAEDALQALRKAEFLVEQALQHTKEGGLTHEAALRNLGLTLRSEFLLEHPAATLVNVQTERNHFKVRRQMNRRSAESHARKRARERGEIPEGHGIATLFPPNETPSEAWIEDDGMDEPLKEAGLFPGPEDNADSAAKRGGSEDNAAK